MPRPRATQSHDVTIFDVAQRAGVAIATVSRVLGGSTLHSEKTKAAVIQAAEALGYQPNSAARNLSARTTDLIAVCGWFLGSNEETFPAELVLKGVMHGLGGTRFGLFMVQRRGESGEHRDVLKGFSRQRFVSGSIWINSVLPEDDLALVRKSRIPIVQVETSFSGSDSVICDNVHGGGLGIEHLLALGRRKLALLVGLPNPAQAERLKGCRQAMRKAGIAWKDVRILEVPGFDFLGGMAVSEKLARARAKGEKIDGVFSLAGDKPALGLIHGLKERGIQVPLDVAVVGYDGMPEGAYSDPALTTVKQPLFQMGVEAARLLCGRLEAPGSPFQRICLPPSLVRRASA